jgi:hypothetical protein
MISYDDKFNISLIKSRDVCSTVSAQEYADELHKAIIEYIELLEETNS